MPGPRRRGVAHARRTTSPIRVPTCTARGASPIGRSRIKVVALVIERPRDADPELDRLANDRCLGEQSLLVRRQLEQHTHVARASDGPCPKRTTALGAGRLERLLGHVAPEVVEAVELARLGREDVQDDVEVVGDDPGRLALAGDRARAAGRRPSSGGRAPRPRCPSSGAALLPGAHDEVVGVGAHRLHVEDDDVPRELLLRQRRDAACLFDRRQARSSVAGAAVEAVALDQRPDRRRDELVDVLARSSRARSSREAIGSGSRSKKRDPLGLRELARAPRRAARAGNPGRVATPSRTSRSTSSGSFQPRKSANSSAPSRKTALPPTPDGRGACRSCGRARRARPARPGTRRGRARAASRPASRPPCGPGRPRRRRPRRRARALLRGRAREARRARCAAGRTRRRRARSRHELERVVADLDRGAATRAGLAQRALELLLARRRADDAEAVLGAQQAPRPGLRLRAVDQEVGDPSSSPRSTRRRLGHEREERAAELVDPCAGRAGERGRRRRSARPRSRTPGRARGRSCSARRSAAARRGPAP